MPTQTEQLKIQVEDERLAANFLSPPEKVPGILFIHGWGGSQQRDLARAHGIAGLGCVCLTFDLRGHENSTMSKETVTRDHNSLDILAAYDRLTAHPAVDKESIAVIGTSYGGYLAAFLTTMRPVKWLALRAPALYWDEQWAAPKHSLNREELAVYRRKTLGPEDNRALAACAQFEGDVLLVESGHDDFVPHTVMMNYRSAFTRAHSLTHRILKDADHALSSVSCQKAYTSILSTWISEMVIGSRTDNYPHYSPVYS